MFRVRNGSVAKLNRETMGQLVGLLDRGLGPSQGLLSALFFLRRSTDGPKNGRLLNGARGSVVG
jgi:hypothetical protein